MNTISDNEFEYSLSEFGFGVVYQTNGTDTSSYFYNMTTDYSVVFNINFQGMGLPSELFSNFSNLIQNLTAGQSTACTASNDGTCVLPGPCSDFAFLESYSFQMMFGSNSTQYMRVPLQAFFDSSFDSCTLQVSYLDTSLAESSSVILGSMFF